jgi:DNA sulfur modification protein DndE
MTPPDSVKLSERAKTQLITMKRRTGIQNWNVLCRWAFCLSIAEPSRPPDEVVPADSSVEMTWKTFSGGAEDVYWGMLVARAEDDGVPIEKLVLGQYFRLHLHRGISYLAGTKGASNLVDMVKLACERQGRHKDGVLAESN